MYLRGIVHYPFLFLEKISMTLVTLPSMKEIHDLLLAKNCPRVIRFKKSTLWTMFAIQYSLISLLPTDPSLRSSCFCANVYNTLDEEGREILIQKCLNRYWIKPIIRSFYKYVITIIYDLSWPGLCVYDDVRLIYTFFIEKVGKRNHQLIGKYK